MERARVILADDREEFLAVEARVLEPEFEVIATAADGRAAVELAVSLGPDVVVLDIAMPGLGGIEAARLLRAAGSPARIVFLTVHDDPDFLRAGLAAGAAGYVVKSRLASDLVAALRAVLTGRSFVSPSIEPR